MAKGYLYGSKNNRGFFICFFTPKMQEPNIESLLEAIKDAKEHLGINKCLNCKNKTRFTCSTSFQVICTNRLCRKRASVFSGSVLKTSKKE